MENINDLIKKANILVEALPYIQNFENRTFVIKYGGSAMINDELKNSVMDDVTLLKFIGIHPILVHGGGPDINRALDDLNIKSEFRHGLRVTDGATMDVAQMVLVGKTNKEIVSLLNRKGGRAIGICGIDGNLLMCKKKLADGEDIGFVGDIVSVNTKILKHLSHDEYIPVIAPIGVDETGQSYNINADTVASAVACAIGAEKLIALTDVEGVLDSGGNIIYEILSRDIKAMIDNGVITGGMIPKILGSLEAIAGGVGSVHIIDGRISHCILLEIFTKTGIGTMIK